VMASSGALALISVLLYSSTSAGSGIGLLYATLFLLAAVRTFIAPAEQALLPDLLPTEAFASAVAWSSSIWQLGAIVGPATSYPETFFFAPKGYQPPKRPATKPVSALPGSTATAP